MLFSSTKTLKLAESKFAQHTYTNGDSGVGKTQFISQILNRIQERGDIAVVLDSKAEFQPQFYNPRRGDVILSPIDNRTAYWEFEEEIDGEEDAIGLMMAFYPSKPNNPQGEWFDEQAARVGAFVQQKHRLNCTEYGRILANPALLHEMVKGSEHAQTLNKNAAPQLAGILATMNRVGAAFRMMPGPEEKKFRSTINIRKWAREQEGGWLFFPNSAETRDALRPLQAGWTDTSILRIMSTPRKGKKRIWVILDELDSIGKLTKLAEGMTMMRSSGNPMVLGTQNAIQGEERYGKTFRTIISQAFTKVIFATSEPESAKYLEEMIGHQEVQSWRSSRTTGITGRHERDNLSGPEEKKRELVMADEIKGLPDLMGYFVQRPLDKSIGLSVVPIEIPYKKPKYKHRAIVPRKISEINRTPVRSLDELEKEWREAQGASGEKTDSARTDGVKPPRSSVVFDSPRLVTLT